jgi:hypothetical protein
MRTSGRVQQDATMQYYETFTQALLFGLWEAVIGIKIAVIWTVAPWTKYVYQTIQLHIPKHHNLKIHSHENDQTCNSYGVLLLHFILQVYGSVETTHRSWK